MGKQNDSAKQFPLFSADVSIKRSMRIYENSPMKDFRNNIDVPSKSRRYAQSVHTEQNAVVKERSMISTTGSLILVHNMSMCSTFRNQLQKDVRFKEKLFQQPMGKMSSYIPSDAPHNQIAGRSIVKSTSSISNNKRLVAKWMESRERLVASQLNTEETVESPPGEDETANTNSESKNILTCNRNLKTHESVSRISLEFVCDYNLCINNEAR